MEENIYIKCANIGFSWTKQANWLSIDNIRIICDMVIRHWQFQSQLVKLKWPDGLNQKVKVILAHLTGVFSWEVTLASLERPKIYFKVLFLSCYKSWI